MTETTPISANIKHEKRRTKKIPKRITESYLHNSGLYYLERYSASSGHFKSVMMRKVQKSCYHHTDQDFDKCVKMVDTLVQKFLDCGLLNDEIYLQGMISAYRRKGLSKRMIIQKLSAKKVAADKIQEYLDQYDDKHEHSVEIKSAVIMCRKKKLGAFCKKLSERDEHKELSKLARAGFSYEVARQVLEMNLKECEKLLY